MRLKSTFKFQTGQPPKASAPVSNRHFPLALRSHSPLSTPHADIFCCWGARPCRLETNKLRNVAKFFAHLLYTDALPWTCLECIRLSEDATTSSSRIFIKILVLVRRGSDLARLHCSPVACLPRLFSRTVYMCVFILYFY